MKYGYARVSGLSQFLTIQIETLKNENCDEIFAEKFTGTKEDRPEFQKLMSNLQRGDTLVVTKLDRLGRGASEKAIAFIKELFNKGIKVHILNMGLIEDTPTGRLILTIFSGFAEFERDLIVERTQTGKMHAKQNNPNFREGRPNKYKKRHIEDALKMLETHSYKKVEKETGISKSTLIRAKRKKEATTE